MNKNKNKIEELLEFQKLIQKENKNFKINGYNIGTYSFHFIEFYKIIRTLIINNEFKILEKAIQQGVDLKLEDFKNQNLYFYPITDSINNENFEKELNKIFTYLLKKDVDINQRTINGDNIYHNYWQNSELYMTFYKYGADIKNKNNDNESFEDIVSRMRGQIDVSLAEKIEYNIKKIKEYEDLNLKYKKTNKDKKPSLL